MQTANQGGHRSKQGWNALRTRYRHEKSVAELLELKGFRTFLPIYDTVRCWKDRKKHLSLPLFAGYLFVEDVAARKLQAVTTPGVCSIICLSGIPAIIPGEEITAIQRALESKYWLEPHPFLCEGETVRVISGPLCGVEGILCRKKDAHRLVISVQMLGRSAAVEIDSSIVERVQRNPDHRTPNLSPLTRGIPNCELETTSAGPERVRGKSA